MLRKIMLSTSELFINNFLAYITKFLPLVRNRLIFNSTGNKNYNFNSRFLFEYINERFDDEIECYFVINDAYKRKEIALKNPNAHFIGTNTIKGKWFALRAKAWICSTIESPLNCLIKNNKRIVYHLGHGIPLKKIGMAENNISFLQKINRRLKLRCFTHVTCYSPFFKDVMYDVFDKNGDIDYLELGQPRNDFILNSENDLAKYISNDLKNVYADCIKVLYSPTWRPSGVTRFFPFIDFNCVALHEFLEENNIFIFLREHPYYKSHIPEGIYESKRIVPLNSNIVSDITPLLACFDKLITDYSSIYLDFLVTKKEVLFIPYDLNDYQQRVGFSKSYKELAKGRYLSNFSEFLQSLTKNEMTGFDMDEYLLRLNIKSQGNCKEHYLKVKQLLICSL
ncbi:CDP-glycerol glycerophosphotransferase family protein [Dryocola clanedunensis]|uniref:CDP-glycerol glycerophosphotransferase family protein n=1 Tax=Cedecea sulfonylureivorans TaxID=3051154 RepID=UPI00192827BF|nr:CDP-glycerol glycerophosphotransferase family protein [Cedecea sulfonylureivorans]